MLMIMKALSVLIVITLFVCLSYGEGSEYSEVRVKAVKHKITCILVFGDSSVDPGNNNRLSTFMKSNFLPYGIDFFNSHPSGRFSNGRLATDFLAEAFGYTNLVKAFLDPALTNKDLLHGVSFASAASGYDELTANLSSVLSIWKQLDLFRHYKIHLRNLVGTKEAEGIIHNGLVIISMGTNDFLQNYFVEPTRSKQYNVEQYLNYLISCMRTAVKTIYSLGARKVVVVGVPPFGCMPLVRSFRHDTKCDVELNKVAFAFNSKIQSELKTLQGTNNITSVFVDIYSIILNVISNPRKYGFEEPLKGCCGSGTYEYAATCKNSSTCSDRTKYVFWDAVHPTERMYKIIADDTIELLSNYMF